jgi:hypothetical protein
VAGLELAGLELAGAVLAGSGVDGLGLGLAAGELDGLELVVGVLDGPRVAPGGLDRLGSGAGLGVDGLGWDAGVAHAPEPAPVPLARARLEPVSAGLDGLALGLADDALVGLGLTVADGLRLDGETLGVLLAVDGLAEPRLLAGLPAGLAAGVDDVQVAAGGPEFWVPCAAAAPVPAGCPLPGPPAPCPLVSGPAAPVPAGAPLMALRSAPACASIWCPNGVTAETLIAMMSVTAATTAASRARPNRGRCGAAGCAAP